MYPQHTDAMRMITLLTAFVPDQTATWYMGIVVGALELVMLGLLIRAMLTAPKTHSNKIRSFVIGRSGYKGLGDAAKGDSDTVPMIERPRSH